MFDVPELGGSASHPPLDFPHNCLEAGSLLPDRFQPALAFLDLSLKVRVLSGSRPGHDEKSQSKNAGEEPPCHGLRLP